MKRLLLSKAGFCQVLIRNHIWKSIFLNSFFFSFFLSFFYWFKFVVQFLSCVLCCVMLMLDVGCQINNITLVTLVYNIWNYFELFSFIFIIPTRIWAKHLATTKKKQNKERKTFCFKFFFPFFPHFTFEIFFEYDCMSCDDVF